MKIKYYISKALKIFLNPPALKSCKLDKTAVVCAKNDLNFVEMGKYSYVSYQCFITKTNIGAFCSIAGNCYIGGTTHYTEFVSSSPVFHTSKNILKKNFSHHKFPPMPLTIIENDVWIGQGALIKAGVKISNGAVIGMGSVVTHDVGPYEIWAGNPARMIRKRFDDETIEKLLKTKWWELEDKEIEKYAEYFNNPALFLEKFNEIN